MTIFIEHGPVVKKLHNSDEICQDFTTKESLLQVGKLFNGGKMIQRVVPLRTHPFLFQDPLPRFFEHTREERGNERGERTGGWRRALGGQ
jgi:hypothetical protein